MSVSRRLFAAAHLPPGPLRDLLLADAKAELERRAKPPEIGERGAGARLMRQVYEKRGDKQ